MSRSMKCSQRTKSSELRQGPTLPTQPRDQSSCPGTRVCGLETVTLSELSVSGEVLHGKQLITSCLLLQNDDNVPNRFPKTQELGVMHQTGFPLSAQLFRNSLQIIQLIQTIQIPHINLHWLHKYFIWVNQFFSPHSRLDLLLIHHTPPIPNHFFRSHQPSTTWQLAM